MSKRQVIRIMDAPEQQPSVLDRLKAAYRSYTLGPLTSNSPELAKLMGGAPSLSGVTVSEEQALMSSAVWAAVSLISDDISSLPLMLYKRLANGGKDRFESHPLYRLLHDAPNPEMSSMQWRRTMQASALFGNGYSEIERDGANRPVALWPLTSDRVMPFRVSSRSPLQYRVLNGSGGASIIDADDMIVLNGMGRDGSVGYRMVEKMRESIGLSLAAERFGSAFFGNGTAVGGIISYDTMPNQETRDNNRQALERRHKGIENAHKFLALYGGAKFTPNTTDPNKSQLQELRVFQIREVARWFKVPPHKLADLADATFSNVEQQNIDYYTSCLRPWLELWEQELGRKLINATERNIQFVEHVADGLLRADAAGRGDLYSKQFSIGAITPNEIRNAENRDPQTGGDRSFVPLAMIPLDRVDEYIDSLIKEKAAPPAPKAPEPAPADPALKREIETLTEELALSRRKAQQAEDERDHAKSQRDAVLVELGAEKDGRAADVLLMTGERDAKQGQIEGLSLDVIAAQKDQQRAEQEATDLRRDVETVKASAQGYLSERDAARVDAKDADAMWKEAESVVQVMKEHTADLIKERGEANQRTSTAEAVIVELRAQVAAGAEEQAKLLTAALDAKDAQARAEEARKLADGKVELTDQLLKGLAAESEERQMRLEASKAAVRAVLVASVSHLVTRESDRARKAQGTPEKFSAWVGNFYGLHADFCRTALRPAVKAWLAVEGRREPVEAVLDGMIDRYVRESERQLRGVMEDSEALGQSLERVLRRWETERAETVVERFTRNEAA